MDIREDFDEIVRDVPTGLEKGLRNYWYPILQSEEVEPGQPLAFKVMGEELVAWRDANGHPQIVVDRCPHRNAKLSAGHVLEGNIQCALHGLRFGGTGRCVMIPWESDDSLLLEKVAVAAYPAEELGGYIWAYLGDQETSSPPSLEGEVPEELLQDDEFICFRLPTDIWKTNWLVAIDGGDAYHAVMLHADSQAVSNKDNWTGGAAKKAGVRLEDRRIKIVKTSLGIRGVAMDAKGEVVHHGHLTNETLKGDRFVLPCFTSNPIRPVPGVDPYTSRLWQFPIDETTTRVERYFCFRARNEEEREKATKIFNDVALPRIQKVGEEDRLIAETQGDLLNARSNEFLFEPDPDTVQLRRLIKDAFLSGCAGGRMNIDSQSLVFPI